MLSGWWRWMVVGCTLFVASACADWSFGFSPSGHNGDEDASVSVADVTDAGPAQAAPASPAAPDCTFAMVIRAEVEKERLMSTQALCQLVQQHVENPADSWSSEQHAAWTEQCLSLIAVPPVVLEPPAEPTITPCRGLNELAAQRDAMSSRTLADDAWIAYGRTLAACRPAQQPWETLRLAGGRVQFMDWYVVPFLNGDVFRGGLFHTRAARDYAQAFRTWVGEM